MRTMLAALAAFFTAVPAFGQQMQPWLTRSADSSRSGWNSNETILTQKSVITSGVTLKTIVPLTADPLTGIGDARGMEAQPLILPNVQTSAGQRDVMVLPSMANVVRGVDAHDGSAIWQVTLGRPIQGNFPLPNNATIDFHAINDHWGCLSTGVIDPETARFYQVCWESPDKSGDPRTARYFMHVLSVADGSAVVPEVLIDGLDFNAGMRKARSSAALISPQGVKTLLQCTGSVNETAAGSSGYCFAFDLASNKVTAMMATTKGNGAGIWMAGAGLACDTDQDCYAMTGNGDFDGVSQWGESFIKLRYTPANAGNVATLQVVDHWTPWTDAARSGANPTTAAAKTKPLNKLAGESLESEEVRPVGGGMNMPLTNAPAKVGHDERGQAVFSVFPPLSPQARTDQDLGSGGVVYISALNIVCGGGKDGLIYCMNAAKMGGTKLTDFVNAHANCAKLIGGTPVWGTMTPGTIQEGFDPCPQDPRKLNFLPFGDSAHIHSTPVVMFDPVLNAWTLFVWGENQRLRKWQLSATAAPRLVGQGADFASSDVRGNSPGGMPGGFCAGSSNKKDPLSYLLVCSVPRGDANGFRVQGHIVIYDPVHPGTDGFLPKLWDSDTWGWSGTQPGAKYNLFNKFMPPVIDGGEIILPNYSGGVLLIGQ